MPWRRTSAHTDRRRQTTCSTGSGADWALGASGSRPGSPASVIASPPVDIEGETAFVLREHLEDLAATSPTTAIRLLPGYDQWILGPGTADPHDRSARSAGAGQPWGQRRDRRRSRVRDVDTDPRPASRSTGSPKGAAPKEEARRRGRAARHDPGSAPPAVRPDRMTSRRPDSGRQRSRSVNQRPTDGPDADPRDRLSGEWAGRRHPGRPDARVSR